MSTEAKASASIIGALPFIMAGVIWFVNPNYMDTLFTDPRGWVRAGFRLTLHGLSTEMAHAFLMARKDARPAGG